jgi:hypothetical protein
MEPKLSMFGLDDYISILKPELGRSEHRVRFISFLAMFECSRRLMDLSNNTLVHSNLDQPKAGNKLAACLLDFNFVYCSM